MKEVKNETVINEEVAKQQKVNVDGIKVKDIVDNIKKYVDYYFKNIKTDKRLIGGTAAVVLVIVLLLMLLLINPSKSVVKTYAEALVKYDSEQYVSILHEDWVDEAYGDEDDAIDSLEEMFDYYGEEDIVYKSYEIDSDYKKYDEDDLEDYAEYLDEYFGIKEKSVKAIRRYTVKFKIKEDGKYDTKKVKVLVAKIDGKWYFVGTE